MERNINDVISQLRTIIRNGSTGTYNKILPVLSDLESSISCTAPEIMYLRWEALRNILYSNIPSDSATLKKEGYELDVWSIFSTMSKEEILKNL